MQLRADDSVTRRELTIDEVERLYAAASKQGKEWRLLVTIGIYTGLRLGDCCRLEWEDVNLEQKVIQIIPAKTKKHAHGRPVTIPIHPQLLAELQMAGNGASASGGMGSVPSASGGSHSCATATCDMGESATRDHESRACAATAVAVPIACNPRVGSAAPAREASPQSACGEPHNPDTEGPCGPHENAPAGLHEKSGCEISSVGRAEARPSRWRVEDSSSPPIPHPSSLTGFVNPVIAEMYTNRNWAVDEGLRRIFRAANITMSVKTDGRARKSIVASFHSLRHTFVSIAANAGVPLPVVQSIVGHCSTTMTRHYYHENLDSLRAAVGAIPAIGMKRDENAILVGASVPRDRTSSVPREGRVPTRPNTPSPTRPPSLASRLKRLSQLLAKGLVTDDEYAAQRTRILNEI